MRLTALSNSRPDTLLMLAIAVSALATSTFVIEAMHRICFPAVTVLLETLPPLYANRRHAFAHVDSVMVDGVERRDAVSNPMILRQNQSLELRGWAFDPARKQAGADVFLVVDDGPSFRATYGDRGTFAAQRTSAAPLHTKFYGVVPTELVALGTHLVHVRIVAADLSGYYEGANPIAIDVR